MKTSVASNRQLPRLHRFLACIANMKKITWIALIVSLPILVYGQYREMEWYFENKQTEILESRIKSVTVFRSLSSCEYDDEKDQTYQYSFDKNGILHSVSDFVGRDDLQKIITYDNFHNGQYRSRNLTFVDTRGNVKSEQNWKFEFDDKGNKVKEIFLPHSEGTVSGNKLTHDIPDKEIRDNYKWTFSYNSKGQMIEIREWTSDADTLKCIKLISYNYDDNGLQLSRIESNPENPSDILHAHYFKYTKGILTSADELRKVWFKCGNSPKQTEYRRHRIVYEYDNNGNLMTKSKFGLEGEELLYCMCYQYEYYE